MELLSTTPANLSLRLFRHLAESDAIEVGGDQVPGELRTAPGLGEMKVFNSPESWRERIALVIVEGKG